MFWLCLVSPGKLGKFELAEDAGPIDIEDLLLVTNNIPGSSSL